MANDQRNNQTDRWQIDGLGELTTKGDFLIYYIRYFSHPLKSQGMGQMYRLGQWIRKRYDGG
jgi:hypothetical protein